MLVAWAVFLSVGELESLKELAGWVLVRKREQEVVELELVRLLLLARE